MAVLLFNPFSAKNSDPAAERAAAARAWAEGVKTEAKILLFFRHFLRMITKTRIPQLIKNHSSN